MLYASLDLAATRARQRLFDPVGHYNRPDVFRLIVDDRPKPHVVSWARDDISGVALPAQPRLNPLNAMTSRLARAEHAGAQATVPA